LLETSGARTATHVEEVNGGRDVDVVVLDRDLARLANGLEGGDVDDTVDAALGLVVLEDLFNVLLDGDVAAVDVNLEGLLVLFGRVGAELALGDGRDALACGRERVVEAAEPRTRRCSERQKEFDEANKSQILALVSLEEEEEGRDLLVDGDDAVLSREQAAQSNVRACVRNQSRSILHALPTCDETRRGTHRCSRQRR
jgi:hypothetical protein